MKMLVETLATMAEVWAIMAMVARTTLVLRLPEMMGGLEDEIGFPWYSDFGQPRIKNSPLYGLTHYFLMGKAIILIH
jgi:hypothetical protein